MTPQKYIELDTNAEVAHFEEWIGREYARSVGLAYPMPPDTWIDNNGRNVPPAEWIPPVGPPPESYETHYDHAKPKVGGGGVFKLDNDIMQFATQPQTLNDSTVYSFDVSANAKTLDQLSAAGQLALQ